jgi:hypothetical protein
MTLDLDAIRAAASRLKGQIKRTPFEHSVTLSQITGAEVWVKFENQQFTAAFKERGALNKLMLLSDIDRARGVIAASAGNHSQGLAYHAARLGVLGGEDAVELQLHQRSGRVRVGRQVVALAGAERAQDVPGGDLGEGPPRSVAGLHAGDLDDEIRRHETLEQVLRQLGRDAEAVGELRGVGGFLALQKAFAQMGHQP